MAEHLHNYLRTFFYTNTKLASKRDDIYVFPLGLLTQ